jgi:sugar phosphate isomerase/epimerase
MKRFKEFVNEDKQELGEIMGQFKDASKKAMELAKKLGKMITIMQHTSEGDYRFAENRNEVRKLERKDYEIVDTVAA